MPPDLARIASDRWSDPIRPNRGRLHRQRPRQRHPRPSTRLSGGDRHLCLTHNSRQAMTALQGQHQVSKPGRRRSGAQVLPDLGLTAWPRIALERLIRARSHTAAASLDRRNDVPRSNVRLRQWSAGCLGHWAATLFDQSPTGLRPAPCNAVGNQSGGRDLHSQHMFTCKMRCAF